MKNDPRSYDRNFYNCVKKPEKNSGLQRGLNPWPRDTGATHRIDHNCEDHSSFDFISAVHIWFISYASFTYLISSLHTVGAPAVRAAVKTVLSCQSLCFSSEPCDSHWTWSRTLHIWFTFIPSKRRNINISCVLYENTDIAAFLLSFPNDCGHLVFLRPFAAAGPYSHCEYSKSWAALNLALKTTIDGLVFLLTIMLKDC